MATYYKYSERDPNSQINYAELGQQAVGALQNWYDTREEKKEAYKQASRESVNNLMDAPQGQNQDANNFINNYSHDMINQKMVDKDLFEKGIISEREYTLRMQNQMDGTKQLFKVQKMYQENFAETMQGITDGRLQSGLNTFNMSMVEGYGDFNNSKATINPEDGSVGIGLMENKLIDGKMVRVLSKNIAPVNVIRGKILQKVATFDVDGKTTEFVKNLGDLKEAAYSAASTARAGTITEYAGLEFIKRLKDPADIAIAKKFNDAINDQVGSYLTNPYNVTSVLTENTGKYNDKSFTFDRDVADADPNKILVTVDPTTQMTTLDKTGKNYEKQLDEAKSYVKTQILSKMDAERKISTTSQLSESENAKERARARYAGKKGEEAPPPMLAETQRTTSKDGKVDGVASGLENISIKEAKGVENIAKSIGWNRATGALELRGYQAAGKEEEGRTTPGEDEGVVGKKGESAVQQKDFVSSDKQNSRLLTLFVRKIPNPEDPNGGNFRNVTQARNYFKKEYERLSGKPSGTSNSSSKSKPPVTQNGVTYTWNPNTNQYE